MRCSFPQSFRSFSDPLFSPDTALLSVSSFIDFRQMKSLSRQRSATPLFSILIGSGLSPHLPSSPPISPFSLRPGGSWHPEYLTLEHLPLFANPKSTSLIARKIDTKTSASLIKALEFLRLESNERTIEKYRSNESHIPSVSVFSQSIDQRNERWSSWLSPLTLEYCESLLIEFLTSLAPSSSHPNPAATPLPQLKETGKASIYRLTCCDWIQKDQQQQRGQGQGQGQGQGCSEDKANCSATIPKVTCRECSENVLEFSSSSLSSMRIRIQDQNLLQSLMSVSAWEEICVGLVCGKISPIYITTAKYLKTWSQTKPSVVQLLHGLNEIRE
jgi:hypothetical protein